MNLRGQTIVPISGGLTARRAARNGALRQALGAGAVEAVFGKGTAPA
jgi:hypothetical protein